jgi:hypothetical protein
MLERLVAVVRFDVVGEAVRRGKQHSESLE